MSRYTLLICTFILLLSSGHGIRSLYRPTYEQTTCPWQWWYDYEIPAPTRPDEITWVVGPTTCTGLMTSDIPETKNTPYITPDEWSLFAATVWTVVELTVPPPTQDASHITNSEAVKPKETETLHITSAVKGIGPEEAKRQTEGMSTAKTKENRQVDSIEAKSSCEYHFFCSVFSQFQLNPYFSTSLDCLN